MRTLPLPAAARVAGETEHGIRQLRHIHRGLGSLGVRNGRFVELELGEVAVFSLVGHFAKHSRTVHQSVAAALAWVPILNTIFLGTDRPNEIHFAVELTAADGTRSYVHAVGPLELGNVVTLIENAAALLITNLSRLATEVQMGWEIAHSGVEAARADLEKDLEGKPPEYRQAQLAMFDVVAARVDPPKEPKPSRRGYTFEAEPVP